MPLDKVLYTAKTHTTGGRDGAAHSDDGRVAVKLSSPGTPGVAYFNEVDRGGHFAAWEQPALFASELRAAFKSIR